MQCSIAGVGYGPNANDLSQFVQSLHSFDEASAKVPESVNIAHQFFTAIAICNTAVVNKLADIIGEEADQATSFDEEALVGKVANLGVTLTYHTESFITLSIFGKDVKYEVLNVLEFDSFRKRMSVLLRAPDKSIILFCKGIKSEIFSLLIPSSYDDATQEHSDEFASEGWHTLAVCYRAVSDEEYQKWKRTFTETKRVLVKRAGGVTTSMEKDLTLLGAVVQSFALQTMWDLILPHVPLPRCTEARVASMPFPFSKLLPFNHHMTHTLEAHFQQPTKLQVYSSKKTDDVYARAITLSIENSRAGGELKIQFAILCVYLQYVPPQARKEILEEKIPMGRILKQNNIATHVQLQSVIKVQESEELSKHITLPTYGRTALIFCDGKPAIHVLEILNGDCY